MLKFSRAFAVALQQVLLESHRVDGSIGESSIIARLRARIGFFGILPKFEFVVALLS